MQIKRKSGKCILTVRNKANLLHKHHQQSLQKKVQLDKRAEIIVSLDIMMHNLIIAYSDIPGSLWLHNISPLTNTHTPN